jgi:hypothetical protein
VQADAGGRAQSLSAMRVVKAFGGERARTSTRAGSSTRSSPVRRRPDGVDWYLSGMLLRRAERAFHRLEEDWPAGFEEVVEASHRALGR